MATNKRFPAGKVSLERALSKLGYASRTQACQMIREGRVKVAGVVCKRPGYAVNPERDRITVDGAAVKKAERTVLIFHKPKGVVTTRSDEKARKTVFDALGTSSASLHAVGRLDMHTTGLLLLTNDTRLSDWLTDPKNQVPRVYVVTVRGLITEEKAQTLPAKAVAVRKSSQKETHLIVTLIQGKNREIRNMFLEAGHEVTRLKRISYGGLELGDLEPGQSRKVREDELKMAFPGFPGI